MTGHLHSSHKIISYVCRQRKVITVIAIHELSQVALNYPNNNQSATLASGTCRDCIADTDPHRSF